MFDDMEVGTTVFGGSFAVVVPEWTMTTEVLVAGGGAGLAVVGVVVE